MKSKIYTYKPQSNFNQAIKKLSSIGVRPTKQRLILDKLLFENGDRHISAEEIFDELKKDDSRHLKIKGQKLSKDGKDEGKDLKSQWMKGPGSSSSDQINAVTNEQAKTYEPWMNGREVFKNAVARFPEVIQEALDHNNLSLEDVSLIIPHQANLRIMQSVAKRMGVEMDKLYSNIQKYGNTTAASIPIAMCEALEEGRIKDGDYIILAAFGAGYTWASAAIRW